MKAKEAFKSTPRRVGLGLLSLVVVVVVVVSAKERGRTEVHVLSVRNRESPLSLNRRLVIRGQDRKSRGHTYSI